MLLAMVGRLERDSPVAVSQHSELQNGKSKSLAKRDSICSDSVLKYVSFSFLPFCFRLSFVGGRVFQWPESSECLNLT